MASSRHSSSFSNSQVNANDSSSTPLNLNPANSNSSSLFSLSNHTLVPLHSHSQSLSMSSAHSSHLNNPYTLFFSGHPLHGSVNPGHGLGNGYGHGHGHGHGHPSPSHGIGIGHALHGHRDPEQFQEIKSISLEWKLSNLKHIFDSSRGENKSKCIKSSLFGDGKWEVYFYANSGTDYVSLYLSAEPTHEERERGLRAAAKKASNNSLVTTGILPSSASSSSRQASAGAGAVGTGASGASASASGTGTGNGNGNGNGQASGSTPSKQTPAATTTTNSSPWVREGSYRFIFEIRACGTSTNSNSNNSTSNRANTSASSISNMPALKLMEATDHVFSSEARNWGWQSFIKRNDVYYNNLAIKSADAFVIVCTITYSPGPPSTTNFNSLIYSDSHYLSKRFVPVDLLGAFAGMFNDPYYSDVRFIIRSRSTSTGKRRQRVLYAIKRILSARSEYFATMFSSGFSEGDTGSVRMTNSDTVGNDTNRSYRRNADKSVKREQERMEQDGYENVTDDDDDEFDEDGGPSDESSVDSDEEMFYYDDDSEDDGVGEEEEEQQVQQSGDLDDEMDGQGTGAEDQAMQTGLASPAELVTEKLPRDSSKLVAPALTTVNSSSSGDSAEGTKGHGDQEHEDIFSTPSSTRRRRTVRNDDSDMPIDEDTSDSRPASPTKSQNQSQSQSSLSRQNSKYNLRATHSRSGSMTLPTSPLVSTPKQERSNVGPNQGFQSPRPASIRSSTFNKPLQISQKTRPVSRGSRRPPRRRNMVTVVVKDASYATYKALLYYLYTDNIHFAPLSSGYHVARDTAEALGKNFRFANRKQFFEFEARSSPYPNLYNHSITIKTSNGDTETIPAASVKAIYKLSDKLNMKELKIKSLNFLINNLNLVNLPYEVFSNFSLNFAEVQKVEIDMMLANWSELRRGQAMKNVFRLVRQDPDRFPAFEDVWERLIENLEYRLSPGATGGDSKE